MPMRDDNERALGILLAQPFAEPSGERVIPFAIRRTEIPVIASVAIEHARRARGDVTVGQTVPGADRQLAEPIVKPQLQRRLEMLPNDFGGSLCASQRAETIRADRAFGSAPISRPMAWACAMPVAVKGESDRP